MNHLREVLARKIEANGGYGSWYTHYALEWNVACYCYNTGFNDLFEAALKRVEEDFGVPISSFVQYVRPKELKEVREDWDKHSEERERWSRVIEDMQYSVTDDDTYKFVRPEIAKRYGLEQGDYFDVKYAFEGRGGKHLVMTEFEGHKLNMSSEALAEAIRDDNDGSYPNSWCVKLLAMIEECDLMFTRKAVEDEFMYQMTYILANDLWSAYRIGLAAAEEEIERQFWAERGVMTI